MNRSPFPEIKIKPKRYKSRAEFTLAAWAVAQNSVAFTYWILQVPFSAWGQGQDLGVNTWNNGVFLLLPSENRTLAPSSCVKCKHSFRQDIQSSKPSILKSFHLLHYTFTHLQAFSLFQISVSGDDQKSGGRPAGSGVERGKVFVRRIFRRSSTLTESLVQTTSVHSQILRYYIMFK